MSETPDCPHCGKPMELLFPLKDRYFCDSWPCLAKEYLVALESKRARLD